ncbi:glycoside hydrolase family 5 protein [Natrinema amylolyticum]|uniref:glycoside hydrolase family 5 protein n=1 Tax=Natrinema amylolyticum TaxID=2878679 RepID=UPI001CFB675D|nr:cellulase family glycosylhydrolase [Natrinema amylolyticum]
MTTNDHETRRERNRDDPTTHANRSPPNAIDGGGPSDPRSGGMRHSRRGFLAMAGVGTTGVAASLLADPARAADGAADRGIETPWLERDGNVLRDPTGNEVVLRGVNVIDPARTARSWRRPLSETIDHATDPDRNWYARIIRIPVQTGDIVSVDPDDGSVSDEPQNEVDPGTFTRTQLEAYVEHHLRPVVEHCKAVGVYCIVDYHRHSDTSLEYTDPDLDEEVRLFWNTVAPEFADDSHVLYEVYNEPIGPYAGQEPGEEYDVRGADAEQTWLQWRETAQPWVDAIRDHAERNVVIIGSPRWSQYTYWAPRHEFEGENLAYAGHVYAGHDGLRPLGDYFGEPSEEVPVFLTEFGYQGDAGTPLTGTTSEHGAMFEAFFDEYDTVHPQIWCFDPAWQPTMFDSDDDSLEWELLGGEEYQGEWWQTYLADRRTDDLPETTDGSDSIAVGDYEARDTDGDGRYEDVTGDGETTHEDVDAFFDNLESDGVQENPEAFDFDGNGRTGFSDVLELLRRV